MQLLRSSNRTRTRTMTPRQWTYGVAALVIASSTSTAVAHRNDSLLHKSDPHNLRNTLTPISNTKRRYLTLERENLLTCFENMVQSDLDTDIEMGMIEYSTFVEYMSDGYYMGGIELEDLPLAFTLSFLNSACNGCTPENQETCCEGGYLDIGGADGDFSNVCDDLVNPEECTAQELYLAEACEEVLRAIEYSKTEEPTPLPTAAPSRTESESPSTAPTAVPSTAFPTDLPTVETWKGGDVTLTMECSMRNDLFVDAISIQTATRRGIAIYNGFWDAASSLLVRVLERSNDDNVNILSNTIAISTTASDMDTTSAGLDLELIDRTCYDLPEFPLIGTSKCANVKGLATLTIPPMSLQDFEFLTASLEEALNAGLASPEFFAQISSSNAAGVVDVSPLQPTTGSLTSGPLNVDAEYVIAWNNTQGLTVESMLAEREDVGGGRFLRELELALQDVARETLKEVFFLEDGDLRRMMSGGVGETDDGRRLGLEYEEGNSVVGNIVDTDCTEDVSDEQLSCGKVESTVTITLFNEDAPLILEYYRTALLKKITNDDALSEAVLSYDPTFPVLQIADASVPLSFDDTNESFSSGAIAGISMASIFAVLAFAGGGMYARKRHRSRKSLYPGDDDDALNAGRIGADHHHFDPNDPERSRPRGFDSRITTPEYGENSTTISSVPDSQESSLAGSSGWSSGVSSSMYNGSNDSFENSTDARSLSTMAHIGLNGNNPYRQNHGLQRAGGGGGGVQVGKLGRTGANPRGHNRATFLAGQFNQNKQRNKSSAAASHLEDLNSGWAAVGTTAALITTDQFDDESSVGGSLIRGGGDVNRTGNGGGGTGGMSKSGLTHEHGQELDNLVDIADLDSLNSFT